MELNTAKTEVFFGAENTVKAMQRFQSNIKKTWCVCADKTIPALSAGDKLRKGYVDGKARGIRIRYLTEITKDNLEHCKKIREVAELRHLTGVKGAFAVSESEYAGAFRLREAMSFDQLIYSDVKELVQQQQEVFDTFWHNATPAEQRIREIEQGMAIETTEVVYGEENALTGYLSFLSKSKLWLDTCGDSNAPSVDVGVKEYNDVLHDLKQRGFRLRYITEITKDNVHYSKELAKIVELKHLDGIKGNFAVTENQYLGVGTIQEAKPVPMFIFSSVKAIVEQHQFLYETLWDKAIPAEQKIKEIEEGITVERTEVIYDPHATERIYKNIINEAGEEIMLILPTKNAFARQKRIGMIDALKEASAGGIRVKILAHTKEDANKQDILDLESHGVLVNKLSLKPPQKAEEEEVGTRVIAIIADNKTSLVIELKNDEKENFVDAIGSAVLSTGKTLTSSYARIFESLWRETKLSAQLRENDRLQKEFINIAAHELRTPIQPILGMSDLIAGQMGQNDSTQITRDEVERMVRNAMRLERLSSDILDIARIESSALHLNKKGFNLNDIISGAVNDARNQLHNGVRLEYQPTDVAVFADRERIAQVLYNLLSNAIKFTEMGTISIRSRREDGLVAVSVEDTGMGIDPEILPKLFTKFATKSDKGTGLGLFISKNIIEAHGGRIRAENNKDGKGATFAFSLPID